MCLVNGSGRNVCISNQGVLSVSKFQVFRSRNQLTPGAHKLPFWCGEDRRAGPNTDVPACPNTGAGMCCESRAWGEDRLGEALVGHCWFTTSPLGSGLSSLWTPQWWWGCKFHGKGAFQQSAPNRNPEVCRSLYILMTVFQGEVQANSISAFEP